MTDAARVPGSRTHRPVLLLLTSHWLSMLGMFLVATALISWVFVLPLHARGMLEGVQWEIIGIVWREVEADGSKYPWQEFLLYNPYRGYRYLLYFLYDGHFALGTPLDGAPKLDAAFGRKRASWKKSRFKHFQSSLARTTSLAVP